MKNGYEITDPDGEKSYFVFDKKHKSWSYSKDGDIRELFSFNEEAFKAIYGIEATCVLEQIKQHKDLRQVVRQEQNS